MYVAAYGWDHAAWSGIYYPDDLPPDWRLAYYANEFRAVVVPARVWRGVDAAVAAQWLEDTSEGFRFFLEVGAGSGVPPAALVQALGPRYGGTVGADDRAVAWWEAGADARALRALIEALPVDGVLVVAGQPPAPEALRTAQTITQLLGR